MILKIMTIIIITNYHHQQCIKNFSLLIYSRWGGALVVKSSIVLLQRSARVSSTWKNKITEEPLCWCLELRMMSFRNEYVTCSSNHPDHKHLSLSSSTYRSQWSSSSSSSIIIIIIPLAHRNSPSPIDVDLPPTNPVEASSCHRVVLELLKLVLAWFCSCNHLRNIMREL